MTTSRRRRAALLAHRTQIDPDSHWMRVPDDLMRTTFPWEEYVLARSLVASALPTADEPETDLFAGSARPGRDRAGSRGVSVSEPGTPASSERHMEEV